MHKNISRRGFLLSGAIVGAGTIVSEASNMAVPASLDAEASIKTGLTLTDGKTRTLVAIPPSDTHFDDMLSEHFPTVVKDKVFELLKGVTVVLHNKQGPAIHAHLLAWNFTFNSGTYDTEVATFWRPRSRPDRPIGYCVRSANRPVLRKEAVALLSPFFTLTPDVSLGTGSVDWKAAMRRQALQEFLWSRLNEIQQVSVTIKSAIYSDYSVVDIDNGVFSESILNRRNIEGRLAQAVLKKLNDGLPDRNLHGAFKRTHNAPPYPGEREKAIVHQVRRDHARYLHSFFRSNGRDKLFELVTNQSQKSSAPFQRLEALK